MKIAIIGGGFTGLACALSLVEKGAEVVLFEEKNILGGLAGGLHENNWRWSLEYFYHHVFTNDKEILDLARRVGAKVLIKKPLTTSFLDKEIQLDSPISVLKFSKMSVFGRLRMGAGLALLKIIPNGLFLEKYLVVEMLPKVIGSEGYRTVWGKLLKAKFGPYVQGVNMAWFWTRVSKRTKNLGYFEEGFQSLINKTGQKIVGLGGKIRLGEKIKTVKKNDGNKWLVDGEEFDGVVITTPQPIAEKMVKDKLPSFPRIPYLWGQTLVLELNQKLIKGYWMNILESNWPFLVTVEHTNMIDKKYYGNNRVVYLGNYLAEGDKQLKMSKEALVAKYLPYLRKINSHFRKKWIKKSSLFREPFAQPVFPTNYSKQLIDTKTKITGLYLANMSMVYPYDRGTNYAVKMGNEVAKHVLRDLR